MSVMLIATLLALQGPYYLSFTPGDVLKYSETFKVTEMVGNKKFSAEASRDQTIVVKKWERNRATLEIKFSEPVARGTGDSMSLAASLKSWLYREDGEVTVDQRGILKRPGFPSGDRPFFGFNVPGHRDSLPKDWKAKLLPPVGMDKPIEFKYSPVNATGLPALYFIGTAKDKESEITCDGTVRFDAGKVASTRTTCKVVDSDGSVEFEYVATRH
ncbi:MAG: hypothetical protein ABL949_07645 [Fimbriimonadaceae bacterium]